MKESEQQHIFNNWISQHKALLFKVVRAYAFASESQDDLFQEISLQVWRSIPRFRQESADSTWLYRISLNTAIKWSTKERKHGGHQSLDHMEHALLEDNPMDERLAWLYDEIATFDEIDRSLTLLLLDGFSYKEMANLLGISESNIGVKIHRVKKYLISKSSKYDNHGI
ncbi:MAG: RNA polymerase sigma factor [Cytophagales bacterium]|nr:RNA polymerase sigma factor [Cytophagales bacterium]